MTLNTLSHIRVTYHGRNEKNISDFLSSTNVVKGVDLDDVSSTGDIVEIDESQAWFWTEEWQARHRLAISELSSGNYVEFDNGDDFIASLDNLENE
jgi:hypothetical protein